MEKPQGLIDLENKLGLLAVGTFVLLIIFVVGGFYLTFKLECEKIGMSINWADDSQGKCITLEE